jgi:Right handed beta helix region
MKYVPPYGRESEGDAAHYINGNPAEGRQGSIPPAAAFENPMRELVAIIDKSNLVPTDTDLLQAAKGIRSQYMNWAIDTGSANLLSCSFDPPIGSYNVGLTIRVRINATNTGAATIDAGAGRVPIKLMNGGGTGPGDLPGSGVAEFTYDGAAFQMTNFFGLAGGGTGDVINTYINIPYTVADPASIPNLVIAVFNPAPATLTAGDPFLVKMINTNTGSSVLRIKSPTGWHPDKPIKPNGGDITLQGDMQTNDVVLFIYDGTSFWIQPNPLISADTTINIPSQYSTVENALLAIRRKTIAQNARVTLQIAQSVISPFTINHANADRITVKGTMKIPGTLTSSLFFQTGPSAAARQADSQNNYSMLKARYGTEVQVLSSFAGGGISNLGPGMPIIEDILITGPNYWSGDPIARWTGTSLGLGRALQLTNVSVWGVDIAFYGGGIHYCTNCFASSCWRAGALITGGATGSFSNCGFFGASGGGVTCNQNSWVGIPNSSVTSNSAHGVYVTDGSQLTFHTSTAINNGTFDLMAGTISELIVLGASSYGAVSPAPGIMSSVGGLLLIPS